MTPKFSIGIPTLNRADLLIPAMMFYMHDFPDTKFIIIDNADQRIATKLMFNVGRGKDIFVYRSMQNKGVAASWNYLIEDIFEDQNNEYAVILNDDIYWGKDQEDMNIFLAQFSDTFKKAQGADKGFILVPTEEKYSWCVFIINRAAWKTVGKFDENFFPAYFEDCDYAWRAKLAGTTIYKHLRPPARYVHSGTSQKDSSVLANAQGNLAYYIRKWGGEPGKETFTSPFNEQVPGSEKENPPEQLKSEK